MVLFLCAANFSGTTRRDFGTSRRSLAVPFMVQQCAELAVLLQVQRLEQQLEGAASAAQQQSALVQDSLRREHDATVTRLQRRLADTQTSAAAAEETLRRAHHAELQRLNVELDAYRRQSSQHVTSSVQVSTQAVVMY